MTRKDLRGRARVALPRFARDRSGRLAPIRVTIGSECPAMAHPPQTGRTTARDRLRLVTATGRSAGRRGPLGADAGGRPRRRGRPSPGSTTTSPRSSTASHARWSATRRSPRRSSRRSWWRCGAPPPGSTRAAARSARGSRPSPTAGPSTVSAASSPPATGSNDTPRPSPPPRRASTIRWWTRSTIDDHRREVDAALTALTPLQRQSVELAFWGGHTHAEVATLLDIPLGTVKTRIRDGLIRLRDSLGVTP